MVTNLDKKMLTGFSCEVRSYLPSIREGIDGYCDNAVECDSLEEALRFIHTIKGASGLMGLSALSQLTSYIEETLEGVIAGHVPMDTDQGFWLRQSIDRIEPYLDSLLEGKANDQELLLDLEQSDTHLPGESINEVTDGGIESDFADESTVAGIITEPSDYVFEDPEDSALPADWPGDISSEMTALYSMSEDTAEKEDSQLQAESTSRADTDEGVSAGRFEAPLAESNCDEDDLSNLPEDAWVFDTIDMDERGLAEGASSSVTPGEELSQDDLSISDDSVPAVEADVVAELSDDAVESPQSRESWHLDNPAVARPAVETDELYDRQASDDQQESRKNRFEVSYDEMSDLLPDLDDELTFAGDADRESQSVSDSQITPSLSQEQEKSEEDQASHSAMITDDFDATAIYDAPDVEDIRENQEQLTSRYERFEPVAGSPALPGALDELVHSIDQEVRQVYHHNALSFASSRSSFNYTNTGERYVIFVIADSWYAVPVASILEIGRIPNITTIPNVPLWVSGVINLRGEMISVIDLRTFLGIEEAYQLDMSRMLVVQTQGEEITTSLVVDQVRGFVRLDTDQMDAAAVPLDDWITPYLKGVFEYEDQALAVMDLDRFLLSPEIRQFD